MFNIPMGVRRLIGGAYLVFLAVYFGDKYTSFNFFNISQTFHWQLLIIPTLIVALFMPTAQMVRDYKNKKEHAKKIK